MRQKNKPGPYRTWTPERVITWDDMRRGYVYEEELNHFKGLLIDEYNPVLNVACGIGRFLELFPRNGCVNLDFSPSMLKITKQRNHGSTMVLADAFNPPFRLGVFSAVFSCRLLHHQRDPKPLLRVFRDMVKDGGGVFFDATHRSSIPQLVANLLGINLHGSNIRQVGNDVERVGMKVDEFSTGFLLPAIIYGFLPESFVRVLDSLFSRILPSRSFWRVIK
ncbi:MAG: class I SAM-dependent methyltransferase [Bacteroidetes bacterium]|nr:class I SAM-dependent methyltransferase [Bacteroidota bacterium]